MYYSLGAPPLLPPPGPGISRVELGREERESLGRRFGAFFVSHHSEGNSASKITGLLSPRTDLALRDIEKGSISQIGSM